MNQSCATETHKAAEQTRNHGDTAPCDCGRGAAGTCGSWSCSSADLWAEECEPFTKGHMRTAALKEQHLSFRSKGYVSDEQRAYVDKHHNLEAFRESFAAAVQETARDLKAILREAEDSMEQRWTELKAWGPSQAEWKHASSPGDAVDGCLCLAEFIFDRYHVPVFGSVRRIGVEEVYGEVSKQLEELAQTILGLEKHEICAQRLHECHSQARHALDHAVKRVGKLLVAQCSSSGSVGTYLLVNGDLYRPRDWVWWTGKLQGDRCAGDYVFVTSGSGPWDTALLKDKTGITVTDTRPADGGVHFHTGACYVSGRSVLVREDSSDVVPLRKIPKNQRKKNGSTMPVTASLIPSSGNKYSE